MSRKVLKTKKWKGKDVEKLDLTEYFKVDQDGVRWHGIEGVPYPLPNEEEALRHEKTMHRLIYEKLGMSNHHALLQLHRLQVGHEQILDEEIRKNIYGPLAALDIGCGRGRWVREMAVLFPHCHFHAMDVSPVILSKNPQNVDFYIEDVNRDIPEEASGLGFVHVRRIASGVFDYEQLIQNVWGVLLTGGIACFIEDIGLESSNSTLGDATRALEEAHKRAGILRGARWDVGANVLPIMRQREWAEPKTQLIQMPVGVWGQENGVTLAQILAYNYRFTLRGAIDDHQVIERMISEAQKEWEDPLRHVELRMVMTWGYKEQVGPLRNATPPPGPTVAGSSPSTLSIATKESDIEEGQRGQFASARR